MTAYLKIIFDLDFGLETKDLALLLKVLRLDLTPIPRTKLFIWALQMGWELPASALRQLPLTLVQMEESDLATLSAERKKEEDRERKRAELLL